MQDHQAREISTNAADSGSREIGLPQLIEMAAGGRDSLVSTTG